ncbi:MAG: trimeric intracellular cation channel family protein [Alphaproteobacteria bacterium]
MPIPVSVADLHGVYPLLELAGLAVFAVSGALTAARREMDPFGFVVIGTVTAIGGGTLRDLLLGIGPVFWVREPAYLWVCVAAALPVFWVARLLDSRYRALLWADALGMGLFAVAGAEKALVAGASASVAVTMGVITAAFGGVIRDVLCGDRPLLLHKEIYATAALAGALVYVLGEPLLADGMLRALAAFATAFGLRAAAIRFGWSIPHYRRPNRPLDGPAA